jgi:NAD(P)-dependent dehydrogenase (short-subunit alcohol dehydrogenase family)
VLRTIVITGTSSGFGKLCVERSAAGAGDGAATVRKNTDPAAHLSKTRKAGS